MRERACRASSARHRSGRSSAGDAPGGDDPPERKLLFELLYDELRAVARGLLATERAEHTLQPTALVHEAWLRLGDPDQIDWDGRAHFFGTAARAMRQVLVDHARRRAARKRGGGKRTITIHENHAFTEAHEIDIIHLDDVLTQLQDLDERMARIVELRVFTGLKMEEIARLIGVSRRTAQADWSMARKWLRRRLAAGG